MTDAIEVTGTFTVLVNHEDQYSLWPARKAVPKGWRVAKAAASEEECLAFVTQVWTDMRPLSLRKEMSAR